MRSITAIIFIILMSSCLMAEALPPSSQKVLDRMEQEISSARVKAVNQLQDNLKQAMRVGNLDLANAIQAAIDSQTALILVPGVTTVEGSLLARMSGKRMLNGHDGGRWRFRADGTFDSKFDRNGKWEVKDGKVIIHWSQGPRIICTIISDELWTGDDNGNHWVLTK